MRVIAVALMLMSFVVPATAQFAEDIDIPYVRYELDNGLTLLVHQDHKAPIVAVNIWYHVGSKNERPGITGFAHLFEHLMFNGSENYDGEWFLPLEQVGGTDLNGTTWFDRTNYFQTVPTPALDRVLWLESDRMGHLLGAITQEKLDEQRGVVQNEKRQGDNRPYGLAGYLQLKGMFPEGHPYSWDTIGSMEDLNAASLDDVKQWFETYYGAANAVLTVAGDVDPEEVLAKVNHYFGDIPPGPPLSKPEVWIAKRDESRRDVMYDDVAQARLTKAWNTPPFGDAESVLLEVAAAVLAEGNNSRLYKRLVYEDQIATTVYASQVPFEIAGMFEIEAYVKPGVTLAEVEQAIEEELQEFLQNGPTRDELERVKASYFAQVIRGLEKVGGFRGKAQMIAEYETYVGDAGAYKDDFLVYQEATSRQVRDAARKWLASGDYNLEVHPQPEYSVATQGADRSAMPGPGEAPTLDFPEIQNFSLENGIPVYFARYGSLPVVEMSMIFDAGYAADTTSKLGVAALSAAMLDEGTSDMNSLEISDREERLGAEISTGAGLDTNYVDLSALEANLDESIELYADIIRDPTFPEADLNRVRSNWLDRIAREKTEPYSLALRNLPPLLYGEGHPYAIPFTGSGTEESVGALQRQDLVNFHQQWLYPANATLVVVSSLSREEIEPLLNKHFGDWRGGPEQPPTKDVDHELNRPSSKIYLLSRPGAPQSMIIGGQLIPSASGMQTQVLDMATRILGGTFNSRLNMNLREDKGWAYGVRATAPETLGARPLIYYAPVQTDRTVDSLQEILREVGDYIGDSSASQEELDRNREGITRSLPGRYETSSDVLETLSDILRLERPLNYVEISQRQLTEMNLVDVQQIAKDILNPSETIWLVVGDLSKIEQPLRDAGIAEVEVLQP